MGVMRVRATLLGAALIATTMATGASATMRISDDVGGRIGAYVDQYSDVRNSGERVVIDGACLSACTLVLGIVPRNRICVTRRAMLGFHAAWMPGAERQAGAERGRHPGALGPLSAERPQVDQLARRAVVQDDVPARLRADGDVSRVPLRRLGSLGFELARLTGRLQSGASPFMLPAARSPATVPEMPHDRTSRRSFLHLAAGAPRCPRCRASPAPRPIRRARSKSSCRCRRAARSTSTRA